MIGLADKKTQEAAEVCSGALFVPCDASDGSQVARLVDEVLEAWGRLDVCEINLVS